MRMKRVRDYSNGSLISHIQKADSLEELEGLRRIAVTLARAHAISVGTLRKLDRAGKAKAAELSSRLIVLPERRIIVP